MSEDVGTSCRRYHKFYVQILLERGEIKINSRRLLAFISLTRRVELGDGRAEDFGDCVARRVEKAAPAVKLSNAICA